MPKKKPHKNPHRSPIRPNTPPSPCPCRPVSAARLAWLFAGSPTGIKPEHMASAARAARLALLVERPRLLAARRAHVEAYASAIRSGLSSDGAACVARDVLLESAGWTPRKKK